MYRRVRGHGHAHVSLPRTRARMITAHVTLASCVVPSAALKLFRLRPFHDAHDVRSWHQRGGRGARRQNPRANRQSIGEIEDEFLALLFQAKLAERRVIHVDNLLTHPKNRSCLLLNPYNAHRNGSMIRRVGGELEGVAVGVVCGDAPIPIRAKGTIV